MGTCWWQGQVRKIWGPRVGVGETHGEESGQGSEKDVLEKLRGKTSLPDCLLSWAAAPPAMQP